MRIWPLPNTTHFWLVRPCRPTWAAHMDFVGGNAQISAPSPNSSRRQSGWRRLPSRSALSTPAQENLRIGVAFGDDAVGVVAAVGVDVGNRFGQVVNDFDGENGRALSVSQSASVAGSIFVQYGLRARAARAIARLFSVFFRPAAAGKISAARCWCISSVSMVLQVP